MKMPGGPPPKVELKLAVPEALIGALADRPAFREPAATPPDRRHEVTAYFDTKDQVLARHGASLCIRSTGGRHVQRLTLSGGDDVAADRGAWEWALEHNRLDLALLAGTPFADLIPPMLTIGPIHVADIERTARTLRRDGDAVLAAVVDQGSIVAGYGRADKVERRGRRIEQLPEPELHALRKSLKKLRYGIDFLADLYPRKAVKPYLRRCNDLQEGLGDINDAVTATALADRLSGGERPDLAPAVGALAAHLDQRRRKTRQGQGKTWKAFHSEPRFWS